MRHVEFGDFELSAAVSAFVVLLLMLFDSPGAITPMFAIGLFALSQAGYFALQSARKAEQESPDTEYLFIIVIITSFLLAIVSFNAFSAALPLLFVPAALCAPAFAAIARSFFVSG